MPYLIDGHNLIGRLPGLDLSHPDDEALMVRDLAAYCRRAGTTAVVYFDSGAPGVPAPPRGRVSVHFVRPPRTADDAIAAHLLRLGPEAPNWTVVTSDRTVAAAARSAGARVLPSQEFAARLRPAAGPPGGEDKPEEISPQDVRVWLERFRRRKE